MKNKARFTKETKESIYNRDKNCIICWIKWMDFHHAWFWIEANRWEDRNQVKFGCLLCRDCHSDAHAFKRWYWTRQDAIEYLKKIYD